MKSKLLIHVIAGLLILLFTYTAVSKLADFAAFSGQLYNQAFPRPLAALLVWTLPPIELIVAFALMTERFRLSGLWASLLLMILFTFYIALVLAGFFPRTPCSCGGVIKALGWKNHLLFNLFFLLISILGIIMTYRERRMRKN